MSDIPGRLAGALALVLALAPASNAIAKPIAFRGGTSAMYEWGAGTMQEAQLFYAPSHRWSLGPGWVRFEDEDGTFSREIAYVRSNHLLKRWNLPGAQANVFGWGGLGAARVRGEDDAEFAQHAGLQLDYETLRFYSSLKTDWQHASGTLAHRIDSLQLGVAPYPHAYDGVATWVLLQARTYTGGLYDGVEAAALLRLFRGPVWVEAGVTADGALQAMFMFNY